MEINGNHHKSPFFQEIPWEMLYFSWWTWPRQKERPGWCWRISGRCTLRPTCPYAPCCPGSQRRTSWLRSCLKLEQWWSYGNFGTWPKKMRVYVYVHTYMYIYVYIYIATDKHLEHHLEKKSENRHSGDVLSIKSLEHTQNLYLEHFQAILRTSQWGTNGNHTYMYVQNYT